MEAEVEERVATVGSRGARGRKKKRCHVIGRGSWGERPPEGRVGSELKKMTEGEKEEEEEEEGP